jgi:hypothetical protein
MSTWCEIVRYRANMEAIFSPKYDQNRVGVERQLKRLRKLLKQKLPLRHSNFGCPTVQ